MWENKNTYGYVIVSALMLALAFIFPDYCWFLSLFFLIPLRHAFAHHRLGFCVGFLWGVIFFSIHGFSYLMVAHERLSMPWRYAAWATMVAWLALHASVWFYWMQRVGMAIGMMIITFIYFWWLDGCVMWILGAVEGYPLSFPLLPLAAAPASLYILPLLGSWGMLALVLLITFVFSEQCSLITMALITMLVWCMPVQPPTHGALPIAYCSPTLATSRYALERAQELLELLEECAQNNPETPLFVLPESSFPFPLNELPQAVHMWCDNLLDEEDRLLLIGAQYKEGDQLSNAAYVIGGRRIINCYKKNHLVPLIERTCWTCCDVQKADLTRRCMAIPSENEFEIMICSELFCTNAIYASNAKVPVICLANESWFSCQYHHRLMALQAQFLARATQKTIILATHSNLHIYS